jgi:hypothetical protein
MINRSKKCKDFVLKKISTPLIICRNLQWTEINQKVESWFQQKNLYSKLQNTLIISYKVEGWFFALKHSPRCHQTFVKVWFHDKVPGFWAFEEQMSYQKYWCPPKDWPGKKVTIYFPIFYLVKS